MIVLAAAAGVAVELHLVADEDAARRRPAATSRPVLVVERTIVPRGGAAGGARRGAQVLGRGDRRPGDLGRAVEVVERRRRSVHDRGRRASPGSAEPLAAMTRSDRQVVAASSVSAGSSRIRCSITGTTIERRRTRAGRSRASVSSGSKRRLQHERRRSAMPSVKCAKPQEWNSGAAMIVRSRARSGIIDSSAAAGSSDSGCLRAGALRRAGGAAA